MAPKYLLDEFHCAGEPHTYTVGAKSMSPVDIKLLLGNLYNFTALHHNTNIFSIKIK